MNLQLSLKRKWFEMTKAGIKTEDYREITPYWISRLFRYPEIFNVFTNSCIECKHRLDIENMVGCRIKNENSMLCDIGKFEWNDRYFKQFDTNTMTLGYPKKGDTERIIQFEHSWIEIRTGREEWGAEPNKLYFVIKHGKKI